MRRSKNEAEKLGVTPAVLRAAWSPLRQHWQQVNREERAAKAALRAKRKASDRKRAKCRCDAYKFPHRPGGGLCRFPDPPVVRWQDAHEAEIAERVARFREQWGEPTPEQMADLRALTTKPHRPYRDRYAGIVRQIARNNGLHPIRDRVLIQRLMPRVLMQAKQIKRQQPRAKYRNMQLVSTDGTTLTLRGVSTTAGPSM
ncbi:MAG TPA: hypothetical protein VF669_09200 [Tepidisphaeraceae bacterium]|jgi:hypothetical protein